MLAVGGSGSGSGGSGSDGRGTNGTAGLIPFLLINGLNGFVVFAALVTVWLFAGLAHVVWLLNQWVFAGADGLTLTADLLIAAGDRAGGSGMLDRLLP